MNKQILVSALGVTLLASCADRFDQNFETVRPDKEAQYGYLEKYDALKEYIKDNPNFHLGVGTTVDEYNKQDLVYALTNSNFNETVAGNAMKMASCVADDGSMDFDKVRTYVNNATEAGLSVYGHTLAWHSQQPLKYLNGLIADKPIPEEPGGDNMYIRYTTAAAGSNIWDYQANVTLPEKLEKGASYTLSMKVKASEDCDLAFWPIWNASTNKNQWGGSNDVQYLDTKQVSTEWSTLTWKFEASFTHDMLQFCFGKLGGTIDFDDVKLVKEGSETNLVANGDFSTDNISSWGNNYNGPSYAIKQGSGTSAGGNFCITYTTTKDGANLWDHQATYTLNNALEKGAKYKLSMKLKATSNTSFAFWPIWNASTNKNQWGGSNDVQYCDTKDITTDWKTYTWEFEASFTHDMLQFCFGKLENGESVSMDDITLVKDETEDNLVENGDFAENATTGWGSNWQGPSFKCEKYGNGIPLTDEEKKDVLTTAMNNWIYGMMEATEGKVKAWDVVNEAIAQKDADGDGIYELQSATRETFVGNPGDEKTNFYWQDYLGDLDYVRTAVVAARKGFADNGGNPEDLKLFINDYNLEAAYDQNNKLKSLIHWIGEWEKDGVTKIDGIGSQMHVSASMNPDEQKRREDAYVNMLNLMVSTGKLVRISELDMGLDDENGQKVLTADMTEEQHMVMRDYYQFIVKKYLEIVPVAQQWGICQWCPTDSDPNSGWRAGEPTGLWDSDYYRKHTYGGFAEGLQKSNVSTVEN